ncbi:MAG: cation:proton antiporter [Candidatus Dadabacteria bacterium]|nr:MAG: cation:proton antiporter [Candidatus Dadabacteria bacterium]
MTEDMQLLGWLAGLYAGTWALGSLVHRARIPMVIIPLYLGVALHIVPGGEAWVPAETLHLLADLGLLVLMFFIGLELDFRTLVHLPGVATLTATSIVAPWLLGTVVVAVAGYDWFVAVFVGLLAAPVAEGVVVPILDEFRLMRSRVGQYVISVGAIDDLFEFIVIVAASIWIASQGGRQAFRPEHLIALVSLVLLLVLISRFGSKLFAAIPRRATAWVIACMVLMFLSGFLAEMSEIGMALGGLLAGLALRPHLERAGANGAAAFDGIAVLAYAAFGPLFFFEVGWNVDLASLAERPMIAVGLFLAAVVGKLIAPWPLLRRGRIERREAIVMGVSMTVRMSTTLAVADILYSRKLLDGDLYSAIVASISLSTLLVPVLLTILVRRWGQDLRMRTAGVPSTEGGDDE